MPTLTYQGVDYIRRDGESVLEALLRQGIATPFSCRKGSCHVCLVRAVAGEVPAAARKGLSPELVAAGYLLACSARPEGDLEIQPRRDSDLFRPMLVERKEWLSRYVFRLLLDPGAMYPYRPGQFVNLRRPDGLARSYSLAGLPDDYFLELHVRRKLNGEMSAWLADVLEAGDEIDVQGPLGDACFTARSPEQPLLLVGTGTGLAPLLGIARQALADGHRGPVELYHGSHERDGLYFYDDLVTLAARHPNFTFVPCVSGPHAPRDSERGRADALAFARHPDLTGWRVHLAGHPDMARRGEERARAAGAAGDEIVIDPFDYRELRQEPREPAASSSPHAEIVERGVDPPPDLELWERLGRGALLRAILVDFYGRVYEDERLAPFFRRVTMRRAIEQQYGFLSEILTGEKSYFGERPAGAHHWMVISEELFDYRENLFMACAELAGVEERWIDRWRTIHEHYRADIVKAAPLAKRIGSTLLPLDGFGEEEITVATLCDSCGRPIAAGERVRYHLRLGETFCSDCSGGGTDRAPRDV